MKHFYLLIIILISASCSNEIAEEADFGESIIRIGKISMPIGETNEWGWKENDRLTVNANSQTATYTYTTAGKWQTDNTDFTKEALGEVAASSIQLTFGTAELTTDQSEESKYRLADYMTGTGSLDFLTISGTLEHQYTDLVINIIAGDGWGTGQFDKVMTDAAGLQVKTTNPANTVAAYHPASTAIFRAIIPPASLPRGTNVSLSTLTLGSGTNTPDFLQGKQASITYNNNTNTEVDLKNKRLTLTLRLDVSLTVTMTGITLKDFIYNDVPDSLKP